MNPITYRELWAGDVIATSSGIPLYLVVECCPEENRFGWLPLRGVEAYAIYPDFDAAGMWDLAVFQVHGQVIRGDQVMQSAGYVPE